ncbi:MAG: RNA-binding protein [Cellvibrionaceae bacterium]|jgi:RNA-binding protein
MAPTNEQKKRFRSIAHSLKPTVTISSNGLSESVLAEIDRALNDHELIKIKLMIADRESREQLTADICRISQSELIQAVGKIIVILREAKRPKIRLSNLRR